jgi:hypothetical protein
MGDSGTRHSRWAVVRVDGATILEIYVALLRQTARANQAERMEAGAKAIRAKPE